MITQLGVNDGYRYAAEHSSFDGRVTLKRYINSTGTFDREFEISVWMLKEFVGQAIIHDLRKRLDKESGMSIIKSVSGG